MGFWLEFWKYFFLVVLVLFAGMTVLVTIGGFLDIKKLFARLDEEHRKGENEDRGTDTRLPGGETGI